MLPPNATVIRLLDLVGQIVEKGSGYVCIPLHSVLDCGVDFGITLPDHGSENDIIRAT